MTNLVIESIKVNYKEDYFTDRIEIKVSKGEKVKENTTKTQVPKTITTVNYLLNNNPKRKPYLGENLLITYKIYQSHIMCEI